MIMTIAMLLAALLIAYAGITVARYADADDSPGGVVMGGVVDGSRAGHQSPPAQESSTHEPENT
jgi:hypothetical protein